MSILLVTFSAVHTWKEERRKTKPSLVTQYKDMWQYIRAIFTNCYYLAILLHWALLFSSIFSPYVYISLQSL